MALEDFVEGNHRFDWWQVNNLPLIGEGITGDGDMTMGALRTSVDDHFVRR
jgi:hypothetical protein